MKKFLLPVIMLMSMNSFANEKGNGGDAVVCRDAQGKIQTAELLDFYEGRTLRGIDYDYDQSAVYHTILNDRFELLEKLDPSFTAIIKATAIDIAQSTRDFESTGQLRVGKVLFTSEILLDIPDSEHLTFPRDCKVEQLAIRVNKEFSGDPDFLIQKDIWGKLSHLDKSGLILHESIYKKFFDAGDLNSKKARYYNQKLNSLGFRDYDFPAYLRLVADAGMEMVTRGEYKLKPGTLTSIENGLFMAQSMTTAFSRVIFDANGKVEQELTREANPRKMHFRFVGHKNDASVSLQVDGMEVCRISKGKGFGDLYKYEYYCEFEVLLGSHNYKLVIEDSSRSFEYRLFGYFWNLSQKKLSAGVFQAKYNAGKEMLFKIKPKKPYIEQGTFKVE